MKWIRSRHLCVIVCHESMQWETSQWASSVFTVFHALMSSTIIKKHRGTTEIRKFFSSTPEKTDRLSHQYRKDKAAQTCMSSTGSGPTQNVKWWENTRMRNEFKWHIHRLDCNSDFSAWEVDILVSLNSMGILDVTQTRSSANFRSHVWLMVTQNTFRECRWWSTAFSWAIAWFGLDVSLSDWTPTNWLQHPFQCQLFWPIKTGRGRNSLLLCRPDVAAKWLSLGYCPMSPPCALWHRNILELEPVALFKTAPSFRHDNAAMKFKKLEVSGSSRWYGGWYQQRRCFKPSPNFILVFVEYSIISFASSFPRKLPTREQKQVRKIPRFLSCHMAVSFFDHHDVPQWVQAAFKKSLCRRGRLITISFALWSPRQESPPLQYHKDNQDESLTDLSRHDRRRLGVWIQQWPPHLSSHRTWSKAGSRRIDLRQALISFFLYQTNLPNLCTSVEKTFSHPYMPDLWLIFASIVNLQLPKKRIILFWTIATASFKTGRWTKYELSVISAFLALIIGLLLRTWKANPIERGILNFKFWPTVTDKCVKPKHVVYDPCFPNWCPVCCWSVHADTNRQRLKHSTLILTRQVRTASRPAKGEYIQWYRLQRE